MSNLLCVVSNNTSKHHSGTLTDVVRCLRCCYGFTSSRLVTCGAFVFNCRRSWRCCCWLWRLKKKSNQNKIGFSSRRKNAHFLIPCNNETLNEMLKVHITHYMGGSVAEWLRRWTCNSQVASSIPGPALSSNNLGQVVYTHVPQQVAVV